MAPNYQLYSTFTVRDALTAAGAPKYDFPFEAGEPPVTFFTQPPTDRPAVFSTHGDRPFRQVLNPTYERPGYFWWAAEVQRVCDELRRNLPDVCRNIETPQTYWDLYKYFDAYDIYHRGAQNLWNVINTFVFENEYAQGQVQKEQTMKAEYYTPLFETLAAEVLEKPEIQTKLLSWDKERQQDVLKVLTPYELQIFEGYQRYPEHLRSVIRDIFGKHYNNVRNGLQYDYRLILADGVLTSSDRTEKLVSLRQYLEDIEAEDPFMDKFDIPNKLINGILIVDGTSKTAARRARNKELLASADKHAQHQAVQDPGSISPPHLNGMPTDDATPHAKDGIADHPERCSSAPGIGGDPASIPSHSANGEARVYPGGRHEVDKKLMGCQKPAMPSTDSGLQHPSTINEMQPPISYYNGPGRASDGRSLPIQQPMVPSPFDSMPEPNYSNELPRIRGRGMSQGAFANQIPPYALSQQHMQTPTQMRQQTQHPHSYMPPNGSRYAINGSPPRFQVDPRQQYQPPPTFTDGSQNLKQDKRNPATQNTTNGTWQRIGSDELHGPKVAYRKGSAHGQWQNNESDELGRRTSATSTNSSYQRFNNARPQQQQHNNHISSHYNERGGAAMRNKSRSANLGYSLSEYGCVNFGRNANVYTKFDPCPCVHCSTRDRTIFVSRLTEDMTKSEKAMELLRQHFAKYGQVENVVPRIGSYYNSVLVTFVNAQSSVAAVQSEPSVLINGLGDTPLSVSFRTGSQFFTARRLSNTANTSYNQRQPTRDVSQGKGLPMSPPLANEMAKSDVHTTHLPSHDNYPEEPAVSPRSMPRAGRSRGISPSFARNQAMDMLDRAATQSQFDSGMTSSTRRHSHIRSSTSSQAINAHGATGHQPPYGSRSDGTFSFPTTEDMVRNISDFTRDATSSQDQGTTSNGVHANLPSSNAQNSPARPFESQGATASGEGFMLDYSTVRVRPEKARYLPIGWRQDSTSLQAVPAYQHLETTSMVDHGPATGGSSQVIEPIISAPYGSQQMVPTEGQLEAIVSHAHRMSIGNTIPPMDGQQENTNDANIHSKRKVGETDGDGKASGQPTPKKLAKAIQPQKERAGEASLSKAAKKKKNKNRNNQGQPAATPATPKTPDTSITLLYEAQTFEPAIASSHLPPYPQQTGHEVGSQAMPLHTTNPIYVHMGPTSAVPTNLRANSSEPFPDYRDLMSGTQLPSRGHKHHVPASVHYRSMSSDASTIAQDFGWNNRGLNPGAQNFVPSPTMSPGPQQDSGSGSGKGKGKAKAKKAKQGSNDQRSASQAPLNRKANVSTPTGFKDVARHKTKNNKSNEARDPESRNSSPNISKATKTSLISGSSSLPASPESSRGSKTQKKKTKPAFNKAVGSQFASQGKNKAATESTATAKAVDVDKPDEPAKPIITAADFPALPPPQPSSAKRKPLPALAPIPLLHAGARAFTGPWRKGAAAPAAKTEGAAPKEKDDGKTESGEMPPPDGERKGA
ncbi:hypothetical protein F4825DRAFT_468239 [Nemania diffusa]|nr:hypothetical protein F4825DRAFT_468239 [Nemania diffusa]